MYSTYSTPPFLRFLPLCTATALIKSRHSENKSDRVSGVMRAGSSVQRKPSIALAMKITDQVMISFLQRIQLERAHTNSSRWSCSVIKTYKSCNVNSQFLNWHSIIHFVSPNKQFLRKYNNNNYSWWIRAFVSHFSPTCIRVVWFHWLEVGGTSRAAIPVLVSIIIHYNESHPSLTQYMYNMQCMWPLA